MKKFIVAFLILPQWLLAQSGFIATHLTTEYLNDPLAMDTKEPHFGWNVESTKREVFIGAYQIVVAKSIAALNEGKEWNSGKISSRNAVSATYKGLPLPSFTTYYWRVKVWDESGNASPWSETASFETGALSPSDWTAKWINDGSKNPERDEDYYKPDRMPLLRKQFPTTKNISSARLYVSGVGYFEAYLNGKKISDDVLSPGFTTYRKRVQYNAYDVTLYLAKGQNVLGLMLGSGWWNPLPIKFFGQWDLRTVQQTGRPCAKAELHLTFTDGTEQIIITDESWQAAPGPVVQNSVYLGEKYDARLEQKGWSSSNTTTSAWKPAVVVEGPSGALTAQMQPPIRVTKVIKPIRILQAGKDTFIVDMGQNFAGVARIKVRAKEGMKISLRYGEDLMKDGSLNYHTSVMTQIKKGIMKGGPGAPETAWQQDEYITKGEGLEEWSPRFTFHGFRYVEITGWPGKPTVNDVEGLRMNSDVEPAGEFACSNAQFNKLHQAIQYTFLSNIFSVQSDCPAREKMGYGADMVATADAFMYNYGMAQFYRKTVQDFAAEQRPSGAITEIAPYTGIADRGYGDDSGPLGWELAFPYLQKKLYEYYGDKQIIASNYDGFSKQMAFLQSKAVNGLFHWDIGDHEALDPRAEAFSAASFYYHHAKLAEEFAGILGKEDDVKRWSKLATQIKTAVVRKYLVPGTGRFDNATQGAQLFALWYGFGPETQNTWQVFLSEVARHKGHLSTGIFSTKFLFDVTRLRDTSALAYSIVNQVDYPGWLHMLNSGATTLWETWAYPERFSSQNHPMFGSVDEWFYRSLLGINGTSPGFETIDIKPLPAGDLTWAKGSYRSVRGVIVSDWKIEGRIFTLHVVVPPTVKATVYMPAKEESCVSESGKAVSVSRYQHGYAVMEVRSGEYVFTIMANK